jgi:predicted nucleotidyltransferase
LTRSTIRIIIPDDVKGMMPMKRDYSSYIESWKRRAAEEEKKRREAHLRALNSAEKAAVRLKREFGVCKVYLFGTCADADRFRLDSDIDIAVLGLKPDLFFKAWATIEEEVEFPIDLIALEEAPPTLRRRIEKEGVELGVEGSGDQDSDQ